MFPVTVIPPTILLIGIRGAPLKLSGSRTIQVTTPMLIKPGQSSPQPPTWLNNTQ